MTGIALDLSPAALTRAIERSHEDRFTLGEAWTRQTVRRDPDLLWRISEIPFFVFNGIAHAAFDPAAADARIDAVLAEFRARGLPGVWWISPSTQPADLGERLAARGLEGPQAVIGMAAALASLPDSAPLPDDVTLRPVTDEESLRAYIEVFRGGFPDYAVEAYYDFYLSLGWGPDRPVRQVVAMRGDQPVGTAAAGLSGETEGEPALAGVYNVGTVDAARRQGIGTAATLAALRMAREAGARIGVLESTPMGAGVYRKLGFQDVCPMSVYRFQ